MKVLLSGAKSLEHLGLLNVLESINFIFSKLDNVTLLTLDDEVMCGEATINLGLIESARKISEHFLNAVSELKPDIIVSPFAAGVSKWAKDIPNLFGLKLPVPFLHITEFLAEELKKIKPQFSPFPHKYFLHHGCTIGRKMKKYGYIREILSLIPEIEVIEEEHPTAEMEGLDPAEFNTCPTPWLNMLQPELAPYTESNYVESIVLPANPEYVGSTCGNGHFGITEGLRILDVKDIKPLYFTEILAKTWR